MSRATTALDRLATLAAGLILLAAGLVLIGWSTRAADHWYPHLPARVSTRVVEQLTAQPWWPWAAGIGGAILTLLALRWAIGHLPVRRTPPVRLPGSDQTGKLTIDLAALATAAAAQLAAAPGIEAARGRIRRDRGHQVLELTAQLNPGTDLNNACTAAGQATTDLAAMLGRTAPPLRILLHTGRTRAHRRNLT